MGVKIFKSATKKSIMDIKSLLNYFVTKGDEEIYKGKLLITINEYGGSKEQLIAYIDKATAKMILSFIMDHNFPKMFPEGYTDYGGTAKTLVARNLFIKYDGSKKRYMFKIDEGKGEKVGNGAIKMVQKEKSVMTFLTYEDTIKMAHEVLDFIHQAEVAAMLNGKPLYTIIPDYNPNK